MQPNTDAQAPIAARRVSFDSDKAEAPPPVLAPAGSSFDSSAKLTSQPSDTSQHSATSFASSTSSVVSSSSQPAIRAFSADLAPALLASLVHILTFTFVVQTFARPVKVHFGWHTPFPHSWDSAVVCGLVLAVSSVASMLRIAGAEVACTTSRRIAWCLATPFGLHLALGITCGQPFITGKRAPTGERLALLLRCLVDCTVHTCGVAVVLLFIAISELASDRSSIDNASLWLSLWASMLLVGASASIHTKQRPEEPSPLRPPPLSIGQLGAAIEPLLHTPVGAGLGALLQLAFSAATIGAVLSGLPRGVFRWHLPTALFALSVAGLNPPIKAGRRGKWCAVILFGVLATSACFALDTAGLGLEIILLVSIISGLLEVGALKASAEWRLAHSPMPTLSAPETTTAWRTATSWRFLRRTTLHSACWAISATTLALIGTLVDLRFFGVHSTSRMRRLTLYRRLLLAFCAGACTATSVAAWVSYEADVEARPMHLGVAWPPPELRAIACLVTLPILALVDLLVTLFIPHSSAKLSLSERAIRTVISRSRSPSSRSGWHLSGRSRNATDGSSEGALSPKSSSAHGGTLHQSISSGGTSPAEAPGLTRTRTARLLSRRNFKEVSSMSLSVGGGSRAVFDLSKLIMSIEEEHMLLEAALLRRDSSEELAATGAPAVAVDVSEERDGGAEQADSAHTPLYTCVARLLWSLRRAFCCSLMSIGVLSATVCALGATFSLAMGLATHDPHAEMWADRHSSIRGVNIGGWLLQERWLTGKERMVDTRCCGELVSPFDQSSCWEYDCMNDEYDLSVWHRARGSQQNLLDLRDAFITRDDFARMSTYGLNSVRIPFGWWTLTEDDNASYPYIRGRGMAYLDDAVAWAREYNLTVILDMHGGVGSQNGFHTSGYQSTNWTEHDFDADATVEYIAKVAERFANEPHVIGFELINEPELPVEVLTDYYRKASDAVRRHMPPERVAIVINLFFLYHVVSEAWASFNWRLPASRYPNIVYDLHLYYAFVVNSDFGQRIPLATLTSDLFVEGQTMVQSLTGRPAFVGEWSLALPWDGIIPGEIRALNSTEYVDVRRQFATRQINAITRARRLGGYFWTWHAPFQIDKPQWSFHDQYEDGVIAPGQWAAPAHTLVELSLPSPPPSPPTSPPFPLLPPLPPAAPPPCTPDYVRVKGDCTGWGRVENAGGGQVVADVLECADLCTSRAACTGFEFSPSTSRCNLNTCRASEIRLGSHFEDFLLCVKAALPVPPTMPPAHPYDER